MPDRAPGTHESEKIKQFHKTLFSDGIVPVVVLEKVLENVLEKREEEVEWEEVVEVEGNEVKRDDGEGELEESMDVIMGRRWTTIPISIRKALRKCFHVYL
jgi:hypothetical protein